MDRRRLRWPILTAALSWAGCHHKVEYPGPAQVVLGGGATLFLPQFTCETVPVIFYTQGGYHVWASVRARYIDFNAVKLHFTMIDNATAAVINTVDYTVDFSALDPQTLTVGPPPSPPAATSCPDGGIVESLDDAVARSPIVPGATDGWGESLANPVITPQQWWLTGCPVHECIDDHEIRVRVELTDSGGRTAGDELLLVPRMTSVPPRCMGGDSDAGLIPVDLGGFVCP